MSIPPDFEIPDDVYQPGSGTNYGQSFQNMTMEQARNHLQSPYQVSFGGIGSQLLSLLGGVLDQVLSAIVSGAQALGMAAANLWNSLVEAVTGIFEGIASIFTGGGPGGPPAFTVGSTLADAYDKQQELIGKVDALMEDNAGFINLCMSKNITVSGWQNNWLAVPFDTYMTEHKNAEIQSIFISRYTFDTVIPNYDKTAKIARAEGIKFLAPGVWNLTGQITLNTGDTNFRYSESEIRVYEVDPTTNWAQSIYTVTRYASSSSNNRYRSVPLNKPVIIPDDGKTYVAVVHTRFQNESGWDVLGGALWSSFSAFRHSVDTTDYGATDDAIGTETVTE